MTPDQTFNPPPDLIPEILARLGMPESSLTSLAAHFNTTTEALSLWMSTPEIEARIATIASSSARQLRFAAVSNLSSVLQSTLTLLNSYTAEERAEQASAPPVPPIEATSQSPVPPLLLFHERRRSSARRLAHLVLRLATFNPLIPPRASAPARVPSAATPAKTAVTTAFPASEPSSARPAPISPEPHPSTPRSATSSPTPDSPELLARLNELTEARNHTTSDVELSTIDGTILDLAEAVACHIEQQPDAENAIDPALASQLQSALEAIASGEPSHAKPHATDASERTRHLVNSS